MTEQRMSYQDLIYSVEDSIATITLNRPARMNALSIPRKNRGRKIVSEENR